MQQRLKPAIVEYMKSRRSSGKAPTTMRSDQTMLNALLRHTAKFSRREPDGLFVHNVTFDHMTHVLIEMGQDRSPRSMSVTYSAFAKFFAWCVRTKRMKDAQNPMRDRERPTWKKQIRDRLMVQEFPRLLDAARSPRDRIMMALGLYLMCRISEIATIRLSDVLLDINEIHVRIHKSGIDDFMPISDELRQELFRWLKAYEAECGQLQSSWYLVPNRTSPQMLPNPGGGHARVDAETCRLLPEKKLGKTPPLIVRTALEDIGFPVRDEKGKLKGEGTHTLRRSGARAMFDGARQSGVDGALTRVKTMLHHEDVTDTQWYIGTNGDKIERDEAIKGKKIFPQLAAALEDPNVIQMPTQPDTAEILADETLRYMYSIPQTFEAEG